MSRWMPQREKQLRNEARRDTAIALIVICVVAYLYHLSCPSLDGADCVKVQDLRGATKHQARMEVLP